MTDFDAKSQSRWVAWLLLAALAWGQMSMAAHQFEHAAKDIADTCDVCTQLDRHDDGITPAKSPGPVASEATSVVEISEYPRAAQRHCGLVTARGPPSA